MRTIIEHASLATDRHRAHLLKLVVNLIPLSFQELHFRKHGLFEGRRLLSFLDLGARDCFVQQ